MITKFPNVISSGKILTVSHTQFYNSHASAKRFQKDTNRQEKTHDRPGTKTRPAGDDEYFNYNVFVFSLETITPPGVVQSSSLLTHSRFLIFFKKTGVSFPMKSTILKGKDLGF
jgi:hypothetical protein